MIKAENVTKSYGSTQVLKGVSLEIEDGEFTVILGASGSGKSTLLNILSGLEKFDGGNVECCAQCLNDLHDAQLTLFRKKHIGYVFQQYYLLSHLSVDANVKLGADLAQNKNYKDIIKAVGLGDKFSSKPSALSGGEQQRVCIARAIVNNPKLLICDEPTGNLDPDISEEIVNILDKINKESETTIIMATHDREIVEKMQKRVLYIENGVLAKDYAKGSYKVHESN